jgi:hypothetical protein
MKPVRLIIFLTLLLLPGSCIEQFFPETDEDKDLLVVEGLITDQPVSNVIKLSKSLPLGRKTAAKPLKGCIVKVSDDLGNTYTLKEKVTGTYITDSTRFIGQVGRKYTLQINTNTVTNKLNYKSYPMEMRPVPPIDSIYYEKVTIREKDVYNLPVEGCQVYLNTHDPENKCKFFRWEYVETWQFRLPYLVPNSLCWISANSGAINVKNTSSFKENRITKFPLLLISNTTDRLSVKYSMLVHQYSLSEGEYNYWEKLQTISEQVGSLYDVMPADIPSNIWCVEDPKEKVLGYFSVSARSSKRIFIRDHFTGIINLYTDCVSDTIFGTRPIPDLNVSVWVIEDHSEELPPYRVVTDKRGCADCTDRGTNKKPDFWIDD